ncbi:toll/interleukin-1 receptor domain-containing protein [Mesorhizobium escarrei]|uniref:TIR domain-containing protein n=1 Tax=Mesorhizobium escarrei TaxID=666018 RepID=A0ABN8JXM3_9HYPH|nr:hypothetical protein MES5069_350028 [Mesorhizobium escarrei]
MLVATTAGVSTCRSPLMLEFGAAPRPLADGEQWNVFLSYRSANRPRVMNLYDVLRRYGHKVFLDQCVLVAGDQLIARLEDALATSQGVCSFGRMPRATPTGCAVSTKSWSSGPRRRRAFASCR